MIFPALFTNFRKTKILFFHAVSIIGIYKYQSETSVNSSSIIRISIFDVKDFIVKIHRYISKIYLYINISYAIYLINIIYIIYNFI